MLPICQDVSDALEAPYLKMCVIRGPLKIVDSGHTDSVSQSLSLVPY